MLIPPKEVFEAVFTIYQNQCAYCTKQILDSDNYLNGKIIFIENHSKDKPRYNSELNEDEMVESENLAIFCDWHGHEFEFNQDKSQIERLKKSSASKLNGMKYFEFSDEIYDHVLQKFLTYHDPDRFSQFTVWLALFDDGLMGPGNTFHCTGQYVKPTKHLINGKFEIVNTHRSFKSDDQIIFFSKTDATSKKIILDAEIKSPMRIEGRIPTLPKGQYLISVQSKDGNSRLEKDLDFTIL